MIRTDISYHMEVNCVIHVGWIGRDSGGTVGGQLGDHWEIVGGKWRGGQTSGSHCDRHKCGTDIKSENCEIKQRHRPTKVTISS